MQSGMRQYYRLKSYQRYYDPTTMTFHTPPENFTYEFEENFKRNITRIWIVNHQKFLYNDGEPVKSVWGFQHQKTKV